MAFQYLSLRAERVRASFDSILCKPNPKARSRERFSVLLTHMALILGLWLGASAAQAQTFQGPAGVDRRRPAAASTLHRLPLLFEEHANPSGGTFFVTRTQQYQARVDAHGLTLVLPSGLEQGSAEILGMQWSTDKAETKPGLEGQAPIEARTHYYLSEYYSDQQAAGPREAGAGLRPAKTVRNFKRLSIEDVRPGISLRLRSTDPRGGRSGLGYDILVEPYADLADFGFLMRGSRGLSIDSEGQLQVEMESGTLRHSRPRAFQGEREFPAEFVMRKDGRVGFEVVGYDPARPLTIDPEVEWGSVLAGDLVDIPHAMAFDAQGRSVVAGTTTSANLARFVLSTMSLSANGAPSLFLYGLNETGDALRFLGYFGDYEANHFGDLEVSSNGTIYLGYTTQALRGFEDVMKRLYGWMNTMTLQPRGGTDIMLAKITDDASEIEALQRVGGRNHDGEPLGSALDPSDADTCFPTSEGSFPMHRPAQMDLELVDDGTEVVLAFTTQSSDNFSFDIDANSLQPQPVDSRYSLMLVVLKEDRRGFRGEAATFVGGFRDEAYPSLRVVGDDIFLAFATTSGRNLETIATEGFLPTLPVLPGITRIPSIFLLQIDKQLKREGLKFATYLGTPRADTRPRLDVTPDGMMYIAFQTRSSGEVLNVSDVYTSLLTQENPDDDEVDILIAKVDPAARQLLSVTRFGGRGNDIPTDIKVDENYQVYLTGLTTSSDLPKGEANDGCPSLFPDRPLRYQGLVPFYAKLNINSEVAQESIDVVSYLGTPQAVRLLLRSACGGVAYLGFGYSEGVYLTTFAPIPEDFLPAGANLVGQPNGRAPDSYAFRYPNDCDNDTIDDRPDNCLGVANADQSDGDNDGVGDACDDTGGLDQPCNEDGSCAPGLSCLDDESGDDESLCQMPPPPPEPNPDMGMPLDMEGPRAMRDMYGADVPGDAQPVLSGPGEPCQSDTQCRAGLSCREQVCQALEPGSSRDVAFSARGSGCAQSSPGSNAPPTSLWILLSLLFMGWRLRPLMRSSGPAQRIK